MLLCVAWVVLITLPYSTYCTSTCKRWIGIPLRYSSLLLSNLVSRIRKFIPMELSGSAVGSWNMALLRKCKFIRISLGKAAVDHERFVFRDFTHGTYFRTRDTCSRKSLESVVGRGTCNTYCTLYRRSFSDNGHG
jgi:hypothetical protein